MQWSGQSLVSQLSYRPKRLTQIDTRRTYLEPGEHNAAYLCAIAANAWANAAEPYTRIPSHANDPRGLYYCIALGRLCGVLQEDPPRVRLTCSRKKKYGSPVSTNFEFR